MKFNPWADYEGVEIIEGKLSGEPILKGSRVPAQLIADCLNAGDTIEEISYNYSLQPSVISRFKLYIKCHPRCY